MGRALHRQRGYLTRVLSPMWLRQNRCPQFMAHRAPHTFLSLKRPRYVLSTLWWIKFWSPYFVSIFSQLRFKSPLMVAELYATPWRTPKRNRHKLRWPLFSKSPTFSPNEFLQITKHVFSKSLNTFSPNRRTCFLQIAEHVFSKSSNMFSPNHQTRFLQIAEHVFSKLPTYFATCFSKSPKIFLQISKIFRRSASSIRFVLFSLEKT